MYQLVYTTGDAFQRLLSRSQGKPTRVCENTSEENGATVNTSSKFLEVEVSFTIQSANELARTGRRWYFWPVYLAQNLYGIALVAALFFGGLSIAFKSLAGFKSDLSNAALGLLMAAAPALLFW